MRSQQYAAVFLHSQSLPFSETRFWGCTKTPLEKRRARARARAWASAFDYCTLEMLACALGACKCICGVRSPHQPGAPDTTKSRQRALLHFKTAAAYAWTEDAFQVKLVTSFKQEVSSNISAGCSRMTSSLRVC